MEAITDVQELSLEKVIETKLVQNNVTESVLSELKERYGGMKLKAIDDKESYLEIKAAARDCAKIRNLTTKVCKSGREDAVKVQKMWVAEEKRVISRINEVEEPLDAEIARYDAEVDRKANEEKQRQEEAYINRQAVLTKMGATYISGSFVLGEASYESELIKSSSDDIWEEAIVPSFKVEYEKIEAVRIEEQKKKDEAEAEMKRQQAELAKQQEELRAAQAEIQRQKEEAEREQRLMEQKKADDTLREMREKISKRCSQLTSLGLVFSIQYDSYVFEDVAVSRVVEIEGMDDIEWDKMISKITPTIERNKKEVEEKRISAQEEQRKKDIESALQAERERVAEVERLEEIRIKEQEQKKAEQLAQSKDKDKFETFLTAIKAIEIFEMRSGQYRKKMQIAKEKIEEILSL